MIHWRRFSRALVGLVIVSGSCTASTAAAMFANGLPLTGEAGGVLAWVFTVCMGLFAFAAAFMRLLVMPEIRRMAAEHRQALSAGLVEIGKGFEELMDKHIEARNPHPEESERRMQPIKDDLHELAERFGGFEEYCKKHACPIAPRNPMDSPDKRRDSDEKTGGPNGSGDDFRLKHRGHRRGQE